MVFNSGWVPTVARTSAEWCQYVACNPERLPAEQVLDILCCLPLYHLRRLAICLFSFFCFPPYADTHPQYAYRRYYLSSSSSSLSSSSDDDDDDDDSAAGYNSHSE